MTTGDEIKLRLFRFDPTRDELPYYEEHNVARQPHMRVLDALNQVYQENDVEVAYRWYCGTKKCGECAIMVNGKPLLSCWEPAVAEMTCEPLANFPVIRDLVVDTAAYEKIIVGLKPLMSRKTTPVFPEKISHREMRRTRRLSKCIECNVCTAAVPVKNLGTNGVDWSQYAGTAALVRFARFVLDPRDETPRKELAEQAGLREFPLLPGLKHICPQGIDIIDDALLPALEKLFDENSKALSPAQSSITFVMGATWNAFVNPTNTHKQALCASGVLAPITLPGIEESYRFNTDSQAV